MDWGLVRLKNHWNPSNWEGDSKIAVGGQTAKLLINFGSVLINKDSIQGMAKGANG